MCEMHLYVWLNINMYDACLGLITAWIEYIHDGFPFLTILVSCWSCAQGPSRCMAACKNEQQDYAGGVTCRLYLVCRAYTMLGTLPYTAKSSHSKDHLASGFPMISIDPH